MKAGGEEGLPAVSSALGCASSPTQGGGPWVGGLARRPRGGFRLLRAWGAAP